MSGVWDGVLARAVAQVNGDGGHGGGQGRTPSGSGGGGLAKSSSTGRLRAAYEAIDGGKLAAQRSTVRASGVRALPNTEAFTQSTSRAPAAPTLSERASKPSPPCITGAARPGLTSAG